MDDDFASILNRQREFFASGQTRPVRFRIDALARLEKALTQHEDDILGALAFDIGKPETEAYLSEIFFLKSEIRYYRKHLKRWVRPVRTGSPFYHFPARSEIRREPFGCSLIISPWNYPVQLTLAPLLSSVAAGNCAVVKPSELAPLTAKTLARIVEDVFEPAHVTAVRGGEETANRLLGEKFDFIFFTGSARVGKIVGEAAAKTLTPAVLELGGKCPVVVDRDIDLDTTANRIASIKFFNAGQTCFSPDFVAAHLDVRIELAEKIREQTELFYAADPANDLAKIVNEKHYRRLQNLVSDGEACFYVGEDDAGTRHLAPRILPSATWESPSMENEIFGPVLPILGYDDEDELLAQLADRPSPLALYLFSRRKKFVERVIARIPSGSVGINDLVKQVTNFELPFGGVGESGMGRYRGRFGFEAFTYARPVTRRWFLRDMFLIQPPYEGKLAKNRKYLR